MDHCEVRKRKRNPRESAGLLSLILYGYTLKIFKKSGKGEFDEDDVYDVVKSCNSAQLANEFEKRSRKKNGTPKSGHGILWEMYGWKYLLMACIKLVFMTSISIWRPQIYANLIFYFTPGQTQFTINDACYSAFVVIATDILIIFFKYHYETITMSLGLQIKTAISAYLYRKALRLSPAALSDISFGNIVTIITKDVQALQKGIIFMNDFWIEVIHVAVICYILYSQIGVTTLAAILVITLAIPIQYCLARAVRLIRIKANKYTDKRLQITREVLSDIKIVKMYTWEDYFINKINLIRRSEISAIVTEYYFVVMLEVVGFLSSGLSLYLLIMSYIWMNNQLDATTFFFIMDHFIYLDQFTKALVPREITLFTDLLAAMTRLNKILNAEELDVPQIKHNITKPVIRMEKVTVKIKEKEILRNITATMGPGLTIVTGTVGAGKTSLLQTILKNYVPTTGDVIREGTVSYASQIPWLFPSSIKQNILFGEEFNEKRYSEVVRVCDLKYDLNLFSKGDETIVTDKGLNLSKGQQTRINLARAIYKQSDIYILDDCLSALDNTVQDYVFKECIKTFLKDKICIFVSQTKTYFKYSDQTIVMADQEILSVMKQTMTDIPEISELEVSSNNKISKDKPEDENKEPDETERLLPTERRKKVYQENIEKGSVNIKYYKEYIRSGGGIFVVLLFITTIGLKQYTDSYSQQLLTKWIDEQQYVLNLKAEIQEYKQNYSLQTNIFQNSSTETSPLLEFSKEYLNNSILTINTADLINNTTNTTDLLLKNDSSLDKLRNLTDSFIEAEEAQLFIFQLSYTLCIAAIILDAIRSGIIYNFCRRASTSIHDRLIKKMINAVMRFFDTHLIGNLLNRMSQDLVPIDETIGKLLNTSFGFIYQIGGAVVLISAVNSYFFLHMIVVLFFLILFARLYLRLIRNLRRLEVSTRSPIVGYIYSSLEGLATIRAHNAEQILIDEFHRHVNLSVSCNYTEIILENAFGFFAQHLTTLLNIIPIITFLWIDTGYSAGNVGLVLGQVKTMCGAIVVVITKFVQLEYMMTSVERVFEYINVNTEQRDGIEPENWPKEGNIVFDNISLSYNCTENILKNICFSANSLQKIGIIGRTGAGKSSIITTLFRLYNTEGKIRIDGIDTKTISLSYLRKNIAIIPQDSVLFSGTIRSNLDPFDEFTDRQLWTALEKVNLKLCISELDTEIDATSCNFSSGQKQMFSMARAILRNVKILILDEATSNLDDDNENLIYKIVKKHFSHCTILIVAHRLKNLIQCDKVVVIDKGEISDLMSKIM